MTSLNTTIRNLSRDYPNPDQFAILGIYIMSKYLIGTSRNADSIQKVLSQTFRSVRSHLNDRWTETQSTESLEKISGKYLSNTTSKSRTKSVSSNHPNNPSIKPRLYRSATYQSKKPKLGTRKRSW